jgi:hypothetical protein
LAPGLLVQPISDAQLRQRIEHAFVRLLRDNRSLGVWQKELAANALEEVLILVAQQHEQKKRRSLDPRVESVLFLLNEQFAVQLTVAELAWPCLPPDWRTCSRRRSASLLWNGC